jgi:hypothetical protein
MVNKKTHLTEQIGQTYSSVLENPTLMKLGQYLNGLTKLINKTQKDIDKMFLDIKKTKENFRTQRDPSIQSREQFDSHIDAKTEQLRKKRQHLKDIKAARIKMLFDFAKSYYTEIRKSKKKQAAMAGISLVTASAIYYRWKKHTEK